jgi:hypothetical protein
LIFNFISLFFQTKKINFFINQKDFIALYKNTIASQFFNLFPGGFITGDISRGIINPIEKMGKTKFIKFLLFERFVSFGFLLFNIFLIYVYQYSRLFFILIISILFFIILTKFNNILSYCLFNLLFYSVIYISVLISILFLTGRLEYGISFYVFLILLLSPILNITLGGVGIREILMIKGTILVSDQINIPDLLLLQVSLAITICTLISGMIGLAILLVSKRRYS